MGLTKDAGRFSGKLIAGWIFAIVIVLALAGITMYATGMFQRATADFRGETAALEQIKADPNSRISAYTHFFRLCSSIQGDEDSIRALEQELDSTDPSASRTEQIQGSITALRANRDRKIRDYNARAAQDYTVGQFRDAKLPSEIKIESKETTCVTD